MEQKKNKHPGSKRRFTAKEEHTIDVVNGITVYGITAVGRTSLSGTTVLGMMVVGTAVLASQVFGMKVLGSMVFGRMVVGIQVLERTVFGKAVLGIPQSLDLNPSNPLCLKHDPNLVVAAAKTVFIQGARVATYGDLCECGDVIMKCSPKAGQQVKVEI